MGNAVEGMARVVKEKGIDVVDRASVGMSSREGQLIGGSAEDALARLDCSVLCVKPDDFVSPIRLD